VNRLPGPTLRIVQVNDVYTLENLPRLATLLAHHAETSPPGAFLVIMAGDFVAPSILSSLDAGQGMVECLNALGMTHVVLGNHEDDVPVAQLRERVRELHAKCLGTNVHGFEPPLATHDVVVVSAPGGRRVRVGLVGVLMDDPTVYRHAPFGGARLEPPNPAALRESASLVSQGGCACVLAVTHQPMDDDRALAHAGLEARIPLIVGGHEHVPFLETVRGTWIVKAGADAVKAAVIDLAWPEEAPAEGQPDLPSVTIRLDATADYPEDAALRRLVDRHMTKVHALEEATLIALAPGETLSSVGGRSRPTSVATLICSRLRDALGAEACLFNGGGIRASRDYPERFTYGDLEAEVPFDNEMVIVRLPGRVVRDAVAASRALAPAESGAYLQADDGVVVEEPGHQVTSIGGAPLNVDREYRVAIVRNLLEGMDHIEPLVRFGREHAERMPPVDSGRDVKVVLVDAFARALWQKLGGFDEVDVNHDGQVTPSEIQAAVARATHTQPSAVAAGLVLHAIDVKHQGAITRDEVDGLDKAKR
jgi:2',3'-cyclic-nucleotide 2'-phosphodiesterase (5'-nucleotidase family)